MGFKLIQDSGLQIAETGGRNFTDLSQVLSRQIAHNAVGSLPLAKNALHSPTSNNKATTNRVVGSRPACNFQCMRAGGHGRDGNDVIVYLP